MDKQYFSSVLSGINHAIAIHPGDAKQRLGSQAIYLLRIPIEVIPNESLKKFKELIELIKEENKTLPSGMKFTFNRKRNTTIAKYIELLFYIAQRLEDEL